MIPEIEDLTDRGLQEEVLENKFLKFKVFKKHF